MSGAPAVTAVAAVLEGAEVTEPRSTHTATAESDHAIIIGGTSGLGRALALECLRSGITPIVMGRSVNRLHTDPELGRVPTFNLDLYDPRSFYAHRARFHRLLGTKPISHVFWVAGKPQQKPFLELETLEIANLLGVHLEGPLLVLKHIFELLIVRGQPVHFVVISSTSAYKLREGEEIYAAVKAAKAMFAYQMAGTLRDRLPGSEVTLILPGGMDTPFWEGSDRMAGVRLMDPAAVAGIIAAQTIGTDRRIDVHSNFRSLAIERDAEGQPILKRRVPSDRRLPSDLIY